MHDYDRSAAIKTAMKTTKPPEIKNLEVGDKVVLINNDGHRFDPKLVGEVIGWEWDYTNDPIIKDHVVKVQFPGNMGKGLWAERQLKKVPPGGLVVDDWGPHMLKLARQLSDIPMRVQITQADGGEEGPGVIQGMIDLEGIERTTGDYAIKNKLPRATVELLATRKALKFKIRFDR